MGSNPPLCRGGHSPGARAFTLVELLVVMAILSLLVTILAPALGRAKILVRTTMCMTNENTIGRAAMMYAADNDGFVPRDYWYDNRNRYSDQFEHYLFAEKFMEYLGGQRLPTHYSDNDQQIYKALNSLPPVYICPAVTDEEFVLTYVSNGMDFEYYKRTGGYTSGPASRLADLPDQPSKIFYVMEANIAMLDPYQFGIYDVLYPGNMPFYGRTPSDYPRAIRHDDKRHEGQTTLAFFDGHCKKVDLHPDDLPLTIFNPMAPNP